MSTLHSTATPILVPGRLDDIPDTTHEYRCTRCGDWTSRALGGQIGTIGDSRGKPYCAPCAAWFAALWQPITKGACGACKRIYVWRRAHDRTIADARCPTCNGGLRQTTWYLKRHAVYTLDGWQPGLRIMDGLYPPFPNTDREALPKSAAPAYLRPCRYASEGRRKQ